MAGTSYSLLGNVLDEMARERNVRGPHKVAKYIRRETGGGVSGTAWSAIFSGATQRPRREVLFGFVRAFRLSPEELRRLAHVYTFDEEPPEGMEVHPNYAELAAQLGYEMPESEAEQNAEVIANRDSDEHSVGFSAWTGKRVHALLDSNEQVRGILQTVTEYGFIVDRERVGPCFYSWKLLLWMQPIA